MAELVGLFEQPQPNIEALEHFASTILTQRSSSVSAHLDKIEWYYCA